MGRSIGKPTPLKGGEFTQLSSGARFLVLIGENVMRHRAGWKGFAAEYLIDYAIGSGKVGHSYLYLRSGALFQSPVAFYAGRRHFGMSPGYEERRVPDFERIVTAACLFCHTARSSPPDSLAPIGCERCHGTASAHLARPSAKTIVNPVRLPVEARDSVCEQCHLGGEARILNPGRKFEDFRPGSVLETVFTTYVNAGNYSGEKTVTSHSEELASSRCAQASQGKMWCGSCHDPHESPAEPTVWYRQRCLSCHTAPHDSMRDRGAIGCTDCHMPKRPPSDAPHTTFTDHRILRRPVKTELGAPVRRLRAWRPPSNEFVERNLGLGYIGAGERRQSTDLTQEGFRILIEADRMPKADPVALTALGSVLLAKRDFRQAVAYLRQAAQQENSAQYLMNLAVALHANGQPHAAIEYLERALERDPLLEEGYIWLIEFQRRAGQHSEVAKVVRRWTAAYPQSFGPHLGAAR